MGKKFVVVVLDAEDTCSDSKKYSGEFPIRLFVSKGADQHMHSHSLIRRMFDAFILSYMHRYGHPKKFEAKCYQAGPNTKVENYQNVTEDV